jgi:hypothetical protein
MNPEQQFTATAQAAQSTTKATELTHRPNRINLHFLRAGLFGGQQRFVTYVSPEPRNTADKFNLPAVQRFSNHETVLNPGYLYIIEDNDVFHEYEVLGNGLLRTIYWRAGSRNERSEVRIPIGGDTEIMRHVEFEKDQTVWVAYSAVQWTRAYLRSFVTDTSKRAKRFKEVKCTGFPKDEPKSQGVDVMSYLEVHPTFNDPTTEEINNQKIVLTATLNEISKIEGAESRAQAGTEWLEDMFIVLDDPIGCADDICNHILEKVASLKSVVAEVMQDAQSGSDKAMFQMHTIMLNHMFFGAERNNEKVKELSELVVDESYFKFLLAHDSRRLIRQQIDLARGALMAFLQTDYYLSVFEDFKDLTAGDNLLIAERYVLNHYETLRNDPAAIDRHLNAVEPNRSFHHNICNFLADVLEDKAHPATQLFATQVDIEDVLGLEDRFRLNGTMKMLWGNAMSLVMLTTVNPTKFTLKVTEELLGSKITMRSRNIDGVTRRFFTLNKVDFNRVVSNLGLEITENLDFHGAWGPGTRGVSGLLATPRQLKIDCLTVNVRIDPSTSALNNLNLERRIFTKSFSAFNGLISAVCLGYAVRDMLDKPSVGTGINLVGAAAELAMFGAKFAEFHLAKSAAFADAASKLVTKFGAISAVAGSAMCIYDGIVAARKRDHDVMWLQFGAAISFGASLYFGTASGTAVLAGAVGATSTAASTATAIGITVGTLVASVCIILVIIAVALIIIAIFACTDVPFETYLKNFILCKNAKKRVGKLESYNSVSQLVAAFLDRRMDIVSREFNYLYDMKRSYDELQILTCAVNVEYQRNSIHFDAGSMSNVYINELPLNEVNVKSNFPNMTFGSKHDIELHVFYVNRSGVMTHEKLDIDRMIAHGHLTQWEEPTGAVCTKITSLSRYLTEDMGRHPQSRFYILQRLTNNKGETFPFDGKWYVNSTMVKSISTTDPGFNLSQQFLEAEAFRSRLDGNALTLDNLKHILIPKDILL